MATNEEMLLMALTNGIENTKTVSIEYLPSTSYSMYTTSDAVASILPGVIAGEGYVTFKMEDTSYGGTFSFRTNVVSEISGIKPNVKTPITFSTSILAWRASVASGSRVVLEICYPVEAPKFQPQNNIQAYLAYLNGIGEYLPTPRTNEEVLLYKLCVNGG